MRLILSILMIIASIAGFAFFIVPHYNAYGTLKTQEADYVVILDNAKKLQEQSKSLLNRYNSFSPDQLNKLAALIPTNPENMKLILSLQSVANQNGLLLQNVKIEDGAQDAQQGNRPGVATSAEIGSLKINFSMSGSYGSFTNFIKTIEKSLRVLEIEKISFSAADPKTQNYQYTVAVKTFWLK